MEIRSLFHFSPEGISYMNFYSYVVSFIDTIILSSVDEYISSDVKVIHHHDDSSCMAAVRIETIETYVSTGNEDIDEQYFMEYPFDVVIKKVTLLEDVIIDGIMYHAGDVIDNKFAEKYGYKFNI